MNKKTYQYFVNADERGTFNADVRNFQGKSIFEINIEGGESKPSDIFEDGYMKHKNDIAGLTEYLRDVDIIGIHDEIIKGN